MSKIAEHKGEKLITSKVVADIVRETNRLEAEWLECSFTELGLSIQHLKERANEDGHDGEICNIWAELAELIYNSRVEELTGLPTVEGLLDD